MQLEETNVAQYLSKKYKMNINAATETSDINELLQICDKLSQDTYFNTTNCINRLIQDYKTHKSFVIAYDYDDTVVPKSPIESTKQVQKILRLCSKCNFTMICFTARDNPEQLEEVKETLKKLEIRCDYINEDCDNIKQNMDIHATSFHKIFYNIFLDDRAGLNSAIQTLIGFLKWYIQQPLSEISDEVSNASDTNMFGR